MCIKGSCFLCRNICSAAGRFLQHECLLRVFWAGLYGTMSGYEVLWQLHLLPQVLVLLTALTSCFQCSCSSPRFLSQIPQTGLGPTWDGWQRSPIWSPHRRRWERQRHPLWPCKDHGWRQRRDHCWEWQAHGARQSLRRQPLPSMSLFLHVPCDKCMNPVVIFEFRLCCRQTWLHQVGMSLKSTSGTWIILALQWHQDQKPRCFIDFYLIETPTFYCFGLVSQCLTMAAVLCQACKCCFWLWSFDFCLKARGGHQLRVLEQTSPAHSGLSQPQWASVSLGPA